VLETLSQWDTAFFYWINNAQSNRFFDVVMVFVTDDGNWKIPFGIFILAMLIFGGRKERTAVLLCVPLITISDQTSSNFLKHTFDRIRPCHVLEHVNLLVGCSHSFSMPSSHAANMGAATIHFSLFYRKLTPILLFVGILVAYTRPYVGVHYPFDVIVGLLVGLFAALATQGLLRLGKRAWQRLQARRTATSSAH
jgi:undecaprenyl-diphosphatase